MDNTITEHATVARIRATMDRLGMSQMDMARYLGVPQGTIGNWLGGTRKPNSVVERLLDVLGTVEVLAPGVHSVMVNDARKPQGKENADADA